MGRLPPRALVVLLVAGLLLQALPSAPAAEATAPHRLPDPLVGASAVHLSGFTYVLGGRLASGEYSAAVLRYDPGAGEIVRRTDLPLIPDAGNGARQSGAAVALAGKVYYFGGAARVNAGDLNGDGEPDYVPRALRDIVVYDPATNRASSLVDASLPVPVWGLTAVAYGDVAYLFGGFSFDITSPATIHRVDAVLKFDPQAAGTQKVTQVATLPYALQDAGGARIGSRIYLLGGLADHENATNPCPSYTFGGQKRQPTACLTDNVLSFSPATGATPAVVAKLPYVAQFLHAAVVDEVAYVPGARLADGTAADTILAFDPQAGNAVRVLTPRLPQGVFAAPVVSEGRTLALLGGRTGAMDELSDAIVRIDPGTTPPWPPRSFTATVGEAGITLAWEAPAYDGGSPVTRYRLYRIVGGEESFLAEIEGAQTHLDATAATGVAYEYRLTSVNAVGESRTAARAAPAARETVPGPVGSFDVYGGNGEILLRWSEPTELGGVPLSGYRLYRDGVRLQTVGPSVTEHRDAPVQNGVTHTYVVRAYNVKGEGPALRERAATGVPVPEAPANLALAPTAEGVQIRWDAVAGGVERYVVYRGQTPESLAPVGNVTTAGWLDPAAERGRTHHYAVRAVNSIGEGPPSHVRAISLVLPPGAPRALLATPEPGAVRLAWQPPEYLGEADAEAIRYQVLRAEPGKEPRAIATDLAQTSYTDKPLLSGTRYTYQVRALNPLLGNLTEPKSAEALAVVNEPPVAAVVALPAVADVGGTVELDATQSSDKEGRIRTFLFDVGDGSPPVETDQPTLAHAYAANGTYTVTLVVTDAAGASSAPATTRVVVGRPVESGNHDAGVTLPDATVIGGQGARPGTETPRSPLPGPALLVALATLALVAAARRRR